MGSDPQYAKYPDLSLAQDIFTLTNTSSTPSLRQTSLRKLQNAISEHKMAPLYRYLAHPTDGALNAPGEGSARKSSVSSLRKPPPTSTILGGRRRSIDAALPWDEALYEKLKVENDEELAGFQKEEEEATEKAGETEVLAAKGKRAEFFARIGDKVIPYFRIYSSGKGRGIIADSPNPGIGQSPICIRNSSRKTWDPRHTH